MTPLEIALGYINRGWNPVPVPFRAKKPATGDDWQKVRINASNASQYFNGIDQNVGVQLGRASGGLVDIDCPLRGSKPSPLGEAKGR